MRFRHPGWGCGIPEGGQCGSLPRAEPRGARRGGPREPRNFYSLRRGAEEGGCCSESGPGQDAAWPERSRREAAARDPKGAGRGGTPLPQVFATDHGSQVAGHRSRAAGRCASPLQFALTKKCACNSFAIRTCRTLDLKSPGMNSYKKHRGEGPLRSLQTQDLSSIFHPEGRNIHK